MVLVTMVTEGTRTVLLLTSLAVLVPCRLTTTVLDTSICHETPYGIQRGFIYCYMDYLVQMRSYMNDYGLRYTVTKAKLLAAIRDKCTEATTAGLSCFFDRIKGCNASFVAQMRRLENGGVGFLCLPGGAGVDPAISHVINSISDEDFTLYMNGRCRMDHSHCYGVFGSQRERNAMSLDALVPFIQSGIESYVRCNAADYATVKATCPHWRADLLMEVISLMSEPFLGVHLAFTQQDLADLFEI